MIDFENTFVYYFKTFFVKFWIGKNYTFICIFGKDVSINGWSANNDIF